MRMGIVVSLVAASSFVVNPPLAAQQGLPMTGAEAEGFLQKAKIEETEDIGVGVTRPQRVTLSDGERQCYAAWKTVDIFRPGVSRLEGRPVRNFRDSYKYEIAAYELDKLLGLGLVPPTVERRIDGESGSLQLWVENAITDWDRRQENLPVGSPRRFVERTLTVRLFHQLTYNADFKNARNILIGEDGYVFAIDHSRAFGLEKELIEDIKVDRYSRSALERLRGLTMAKLEERLGKWLTGPQMEAIMARRDLLLQHAEELVAERGEVAVLFP